MKHVQLQTRAAVFASRPLALATALAAFPALAEIAQVPLGSAISGVPPNMMLVLSVEYPTGVEFAYKANYADYGGTGPDYNGNNRYLGYFDPEGCYSYSAGNKPGARNGATAKNEYFYKSDKATNRQCGGKGFSGNFMNWAAMQALDEFRLAMTGGDRVQDTTSITVIQKTRQTGEGNSFKRLVTGANTVTPFGWNAVYVRVLPETEEPALLNPSSGPFNTNETRGRSIQFSKSSDYNPYAAYGGATYDYMVQVKVCDPNAPGGLEYNGEGDLKLCKAYPNNGGTPIYKPVGLIQKYADQIRFGATSYLLDNNKNRAGGVVRARLKSVGEKLVGANGGTNNPNQEWNPQTGIYIKNPDTADATASGVANSGVVNYLNKFGKASGYKERDILGELYYATQLAVRNVAPPARFTSDMTQAMKDDFPVITTPADENDVHKRPIQYACQKTHFVGIADANTHADTYAPGSTRTSSYGANHTWNDGFDGTTPGLNVMTLTNKIGDLETATSPIPTLSGRTPLANYSGFSAGGAGYFIAGLAYWANTQDMLPDVVGKSWTQGKQQGKTYFVDVEQSPENSANRNGNIYTVSCSARANTPNQMYMAAKYGGFDHQDKPESDYQALLSEASKSTSWDKNGDCVPDNYFLASQPDKLISALSEIVETVAAETGGALSTGPSTANSTALESDSQYYESSFDAADWSGALKSFGFCTIGKVGKAPGCTAATIGSRLEDKNKEPLIDDASGGWIASIPAHDNRTVYTTTSTGGRTDFKDSASASFPLSTLAPSNTLRTHIINYLRGDTSYDGKTIEGQTWRQRNGKVLGDIVNSGVAYVEPGVKDYGWGRSANPEVITDAQKITYQARLVSARMNKEPKKTVFVGANDGMLHAFNAETRGNGGGSRGKERFAFVPTAAYEHLAELTRTDYSHRYFVDGTPVAGDYWNGSAWRTLLVTSTGAGGRSYFALDVEDPENPQLQWEVTGGGDDPAAWPASGGAASAFANLGVAIGKASTVPTNDPAHPWVVIFGNGYNSRGTNLVPPAETNHPNRARLFIVDAKTGALVKQISTGERNNASIPNGLSTPRVVDYDGNGSADAAYAGDLQGNLWKFNLQGTVSSWGLAFGGEPLLKATAPDQTPQPITAQPEVMRRKGKPGELMIYVGSGQWMEESDPMTRQVQTLYGVADPCGHGGSCSLDASYTRTNLLGQTLEAATVPNEARYGAHAGETIRKVSQKAPVAGQTDKGFYVDLVVGGNKEGERVRTNTKIYYDRVRFYSLVPVGSGNPCEGGSTDSWTYEIDPWTGARLDYAFGGVYGNEAAGVKVPGGSGQRPPTVGDFEIYPQGASLPDKGKIRYGRRTWRQFH